MRTLLTFGLFFILPITSLSVSFEARAAVNWNANDLSILMPLPAPSDIPLMLGPAEQDSEGALLPKEPYGFFPLVSNLSTTVQSIYENNLKVVGIRLDPCFREGTSTVCRRQVRLIWQPIIEVGGRTTTLDASIHSFYEFSENDFREVLKRWSMLAQVAPGTPLQVHPVLKAEGYRGKAFKKLKEVILSVCGNDHLVRVTGMTVRAARVWAFSGFDRVSANNWKPIGIPKTSSTIQSFFLFPEGMMNLSEFEGTLSPPPNNEMLYLTLITNSRLFKSKQTELEAKTLMTRMYQIENPKMNNPGTVDCVSCHTAQTVRLWGERNYKQWDWSRDFGQNRFSSRQNLENKSTNAGDSNRVRAFGYFNDEAMFSQRVVNETASVAEYLQSANFR